MANSSDKRKEIYKSIEKLRGNPLIVYATSSRAYATGSMAQDVLDEFIKQISLIPDDVKAVDLMIKSHGGDGLVSWRIISLLRSRFKTVNILIPREAFSAATLLALGGDSVVMGKYGCIGPIDPQIQIKNADGSGDNFAYEDVLSIFDFAKNEVGVTSEEGMSKILEQLSQKVNPIVLGFAKRASSLSDTLGEKLLLTHMKESDSPKPSAIAKKLNKSFFNHAHALYRKEAGAIIPTVDDATPELDKLMSSFIDSYVEDFQETKPLYLIGEYFKSNASSRYLQGLPYLSIPPNAQPQLVQQIIAQHIGSQLSNPEKGMDLSVKKAMLESARYCSAYVELVHLEAYRRPDFKLAIAPTVLDGSWSKTS